MRRLAIGFAAILSVVTIVLACHARFSLDAELSVAAIPIDDQRPPAELRLVTPIVQTFDDGTQRASATFPLKHTAITARIGGMMAEYQVEQEFENPFDEPIEAVYSFPLGHTGAVNGYELIIGERRISGEIKQRQEAREVYEQARQDGHTAALVEQERPNVFTQRVANIAPHESVKVKISYVDLLPHKDGAYELIVPLVVGPRYLPLDGTGVASKRHGAPGAAIPYVDATRASSTVSFVAEVDAGLPIAKISSGSHDIAVEQLSPTRSRITLGRADEIPNRDLRIKYAVAGETDQAAVLAHRSNGNGYFVLAIQPKAQIRADELTGREVMIVIDTSGSMDGEPLKQAKRVSASIVGSLTERDTFNILSFASGVDAMAGRMKAGDDGGKRAGLRYLSEMRAGGGTEMELGVVEMLTRQPAEGRIRMIYFLTDGFVGNDDAVLGAAHSLLGSNRIFTVGIGQAPNRALLDSLADVGRGFSTYVALDDNGGRAGAELLRRSGSPYLTDVTIDWAGMPVTQQDPALVPDVYAGLPLVISGRYTRPASGVIMIRGNRNGVPMAMPVRVDLPEQIDLPPVASLWARRRIEQLGRPSELPENVVEQAITELGLTFHLMTSFTSFVAVDRTRVVSNGQPTYVEQPSITPEGVNPNTAVGGEGYHPQGSWRDNAQQQSRSYSGRSSGGGGGGRWFGSGATPISPVSTIVFALSLILLGVTWRSLRRRAV